MAIVHLLGTGAGLSDPHRTTTMLALEHPDSLLVVDCGGDAVQRLMAAGLDLDRITGLILTHEHPDHVGGFPLLMEKLWLAGRRRPLPIYGPRAALDQAERIFRAFNTADWTGMPEIVRREVLLEEGAMVLEDAGWVVTASPGDHGGIPVIGLRFQDRSHGRIIAYSCDTRKSDRITRLARSADLLIHEATGENAVHSTAVEAAEVARDSGSRRLVLVHLPPARYLDESHLSRARAIFPNLEIGEELGRYPL